jgi:hypothetical protein
MAQLKRPSSVALAELIDRVLACHYQIVPVELAVEARPRVRGQARLLSLAIENLLAQTPLTRPARVRLAADKADALVEVGAFAPEAATPERALALDATSSIARACGGALERDADSFRLRLPRVG